MCMWVALPPVRTFRSSEVRLAKYGKEAGQKVERAMHERKQGTTLRSGSGRKVTSRKQAIAIGLSEARKKGAKVQRKRRKTKHSCTLAPSDRPAWLAYARRLQLCVIPGVGTFSHHRQALTCCSGEAMTSYFPGGKWNLLRKMRLPTRRTRSRPYACPGSVPCGAGRRAKEIGTAECPVSIHRIQRCRSV